MELKIKRSVELVRLTKAPEIACGSGISIPELNTDGGEGGIHPPVVSPFGGDFRGAPSRGSCPAGNGCAECHRRKERGDKEVSPAIVLRCLLLSVSGWGKMILSATLQLFIGAEE